MNLKFNSIIREGFNKRAYGDQRKRVNFIIAEYLDADFTPYCIKTEFPVNTTYDEMLNKVKSINVHPFRKH